MSKSTYEEKAARKNGINRTVFAAISIILEVTFFVLINIHINRIWDWLNILTHIFSFVVVLVIYASHKTSAIKMPWIIVILLFPVFGLCLYILVGLNGGTKMMARRYQKIDEVLYPYLPANKEVLKSLQETDPNSGALAGYIAGYAPFPVYQNSDVAHHRAVEGFEMLLHDLKAARSFIFMEYYAIEDAEVWAQVQGVLEEKVKEGVEVRVFYDDLGSIGFITTDFVRKLESVGIMCRVFNPVGPWLNIFLNNRDHRKITVIDGRVAYTGGYNLANEYFGLTKPYGEWKDSGIRIEGQAVRSFTVMFLEMWNAVRANDIDDVNFEKYMPDVTYTAHEACFVQPYADTPMDNEQVGENVYISMINKANRYCYFTTPYLIISDEMIHALGLAAKRGVDVRIVTPGIPDKKVVYWVTRSFYGSLTRNGVRIYEWRPGFLHSKLCVADDRVAVCGTINLDYRSLYHHFEDGCVIYGGSAVNDIKQEILSVLGESEDVTAYYTVGRGRLLRLGQMFLRLFAELL